MTTKLRSVLLVFSMLAISTGCVTVRCYDNDGVYGTSGAACSDELAAGDEVKSWQ